MDEINSRVGHLLNSVVGCAFVAALDETGLMPEEVAEPETGLRVAAACVDRVFRFRSDYDLVAPGVLTLARKKAALARALIEHPGTAWWFDDVDLQAQTWLSVHGTPDKFIYGTPPDTMAWQQPGNPPRPWERYAQKPYGNQITSTLYGPYVTSKLVAYDNRVGDYDCTFPLAWWSVRFLEGVRVYEIHGPSDWHDLCVSYPARGREDDRLVPNWGAASEEWDGVHLSLGGLLTAEQNRYESPAGWTMLDAWHAEQTYWLRALKTETKRRPDFDRGLEPPQINGLRFPDFGEENGTLLRG